MMIYVACLIIIVCARVLGCVVASFFMYMRVTKKKIMCSSLWLCSGFMLHVRVTKKKYDKKMDCSSITFTVDTFDIYIPSSKCIHQYMPSFQSSVE
jgi:hypothetical protein